MQSELTVDGLAQEIRRVDGNHSLGAGALAEALMPFLTAALSDQEREVDVKPLEWEGEHGTEYAKSILGLYAVWDGHYRPPGAHCGIRSDNPKQAAQEHLERTIRSALVDVPVEAVAIPTANCCVCGRIIDTREISQGGDNFGAETAPGKWTCSMQCDDVVTGYVPDAPSRPEDAKAEQYWSTVEQLANCEDEISRLRELLSRAEEYVIDGVTTAKAEAEMNAPYPARAPRYDAALAEVRQLYADIQAALAATRSGSATGQKESDHGG